MEISLEGIYLFHAISSNFASAGRKVPPPLGTGKLFLDWINPFHAISRNFASAGRQVPPYSNRKIVFRLDLSMSFNFKQLEFSWQKSPPPRNREIFLDWIYPFHAILSNFAPAGRKAPIPNRKISFKTGSIHFMISCNFKQLCFSCQKSPLTPNPNPPKTGKNFRLDLSISCNFEQLCFSW